MKTYEVWFYDHTNADDDGSLRCDEQTYEASRPDRAAEYWAQEVADEDGRYGIMVQEVGTAGPPLRYLLDRTTSVDCVLQEVKP